MAGSWLKIESSTPDKPEVLAMTVAMGWDDPDLTVGKLFRVWRWFDEHTIDGNAERVTSALLDRIAGVTGFSQAMADVGWLVLSAAGVSLPNFDRHNGKTAKDRSLTAKRVANLRGNLKSNGGSNDGIVTSALAREEKNREEKNKNKKPSEDGSADPNAAGSEGDGENLPKETKAVPGDYPDDFEIAWASYPKRPGANKKSSFKAWAARIKAGTDAAAILAGVQRYAKWCVATGKVGTEYVKQPATFFGPDEHFSEDWTVVAPAVPGMSMPNRQEALEARNREVAERFARSV